jgi:Pyruvate/2-oxoglutarate dehydrogenase complex, dihydrolipoamide acyltransferase (E2) component, and related enzymes
MSERKSRVPASPKVRKFARELGLDINQIIGSKREGRVIENDVKNFVKEKTFQKSFFEKNETKNEFSHSDFGEVEVKDIPRIKKLTAKYLTNSWTTIPHVTNHDEADVTEMEKFRNSLKDFYTGEKKKITPLAFIIKAVTSALKKFPSFNCSIDSIEDGKMTLKKYFHIGIAVDTEHGLMGPKIRNVNKKKNWRN